MRVLVTRPSHEDTAALLAERGHDAIIAPLLDIRFRPGSEIALDGVQAVLVTSANSIRALARRTRRRDVKIMAVGAQSAATARALGFSNVAHADGDAAALADLTAAQLTPDGGALVHAAGAETRGRLAEALQSRGFEVRSEVLYEALAATALPGPAQQAILGGNIDAALFFSPRTARLFAEIVTREGLGERCRALLALCISQAAADELRGLVFREVRVAAHPDQDSLLALAM